MSKYDATLGPALLGADPFAQEHLAALRQMVVQRRNPERNAERRLRRTTQAGPSQFMRVEKDTGQHPKFAVDKRKRAVGTPGGHCVPAHPHRTLARALYERRDEPGVADQLHQLVTDESNRNESATSKRMRRPLHDLARNVGMTRIQFFIQEGITHAQVIA